MNALSTIRELRQDVHAYDTLAWVCLKKNLLDEADSLMQKALARGTQDPSLYFHASEIARARGDRTKADAPLSRAEALNPYLSKAGPGGASS